ncbi:hypothetical protein [Nocardia sp. CA-290969]|uniref:hypothetical protein n=1 Tax=Nocardia sp. CA-290969 TaxID=3239986 RepID=UPI003D911C12
MAEVALIDRWSQVSETPPVIYVKQDQVRLYAQFTELRDAPLQIAEVPGLGSFQVEGAAAYA